jgi:hypothetical protein
MGVTPGRETVCFEEAVARWEGALQSLRSLRAAHLVHGPAPPHFPEGKRMTHIAHLADARRPHATLCGESWQGWQAPDDLLAHDPIARTLPPHLPPRQDEQVRQCQACFKAAIRGAEMR